MVALSLPGSETLPARSTVVPRSRSGVPVARGRKLVPAGRWRSRGRPALQLTATLPLISVSDGRRSTSAVHHGRRSVPGVARSAVAARLALPAAKARWSPARPRSTGRQPLTSPSRQGVADGAVVVHVFGDDHGRAPVAVVSMVALSLPGSETLPAASTMVAVTVRSRRPPDGQTRNPPCPP